MQHHVDHGTHCSQYLWPPNISGVPSWMSKPCLILAVRTSDDILRNLSEPRDRPRSTPRDRNVERTVPSYEEGLVYLASSRCDRWFLSSCLPRATRSVVPSSRSTWYVRGLEYPISLILKSCGRIPWGLRRRYFLTASTNPTAASQPIQAQQLAKFRAIRRPRHGAMDS